MGFTGHKFRVWRKRFYYMEEEVPQWLRSILFFVNDWDRDVWARKRYNTVAKPAFDKHLRYPSPIASENFASFRVTKETVENVDDSEFETVAPRSMNWSILPKSPWSYSMTPYRNEIYDIKYWRNTVFEQSPGQSESPQVPFLPPGDCCNRTIARPIPRGAAELRGAEQKAILLRLKTESNSPGRKPETKSSTPTGFKVAAPPVSWGIV
ncbi:hypothetical protein MSG28_001892 [Choristoneura fumiferana]|uniref:Uncharacterized protein n=1 Tax=Choristoneura fumiferana TaxID=7141 RepID=A0ACC0JTD2_CHOFU|nr:hypothetical protein MSG28_001892 [Choristoneura fumiferana]